MEAVHSSKNHRMLLAPAVYSIKSREQQPCADSWNSLGPLGLSASYTATWAQGEAAAECVPALDVTQDLLLAWIVH